MYTPEVICLKQLQVFKLVYIFHLIHLYKYNIKDHIYCKVFNIYIYLSIW